MCTATVQFPFYVLIPVDVFGFISNGNFKITHPGVFGYKIKNKQITITQNFTQYFIGLHASTPWDHHQVGFMQLNELFYRVVFDSYLFIPYLKDLQTEETGMELR